MLLHTFSDEMPGTDMPPKKLVAYVLVANQDLCCFNLVLWNGRPRLFHAQGPKTKEKIPHPRNKTRFSQILTSGLTGSQVYWQNGLYEASPLKQSHPAEVFMHYMIRVTILGDCFGHTQPKPHPKPQTSSPKSLISSPRTPAVEAKHPPQRLNANLGFSQIGGGFWEVPIQSVIVYWGLFGVSPFRETTISDVRIIGFHRNMERRGLQHRQYRAIEFNGAWFPIFLPKLTAHLYAQQPSNGTLNNHNRKPTLQNPTPRALFHYRGLRYRIQSLRSHAPLENAHVNPQFLHRVRKR